MHSKHRSILLIAALVGLGALCTTGMVGAATIRTDPKPVHGWVPVGDHYEPCRVTRDSNGAVASASCDESRGIPASTLPEDGPVIDDVPEYLITH